MHNTAAMPVCKVAQRQDFPLLAGQLGLVYLDSAATTQKPGGVIAAMDTFYREEYAAAHRATYDLAAQATEMWEAGRAKVAAFMGARPEGIIFTKSATEALNMAAAFETVRLGLGDEILLSAGAHHSNILPWQRAAAQSGARLVWAEIGADGRLDMADLLRKLSQRTKVVAIEHVSNVLGYIVPVADVAAAAHAVGARMVVDAAQSAGRLPIDVDAWQADYVAISAHKMYGPSGLGVLYVQPEHLAYAEPFLLGGGAVEKVTRTKTTLREGPARFEAGTPNVAAVVGLTAAIDYLAAVGPTGLHAHEQTLTAYALKRLQAIQAGRLFGPADPTNRTGIFSFTLSVGGRLIHSHDVAAILNEQNVAVRAGHHCAQPLLEALGVLDLTRASVGVYTTESDINRLVEGLRRVEKVFSKQRAVLDIRDRI